MTDVTFRLRKRALRNSQARSQFAVYKYWTQLLCIYYLIISVIKLVPYEETTSYINSENFIVVVLNLIFIMCHCLQTKHIRPTESKFINIRTENFLEQC